MSQRQDWVWGRLYEPALAHAAAVADRLVANARGLPQGRYAHTPDERYQKLLGAEGEVFFRVRTGRPLPTVSEMAGTWKGADVDGYAIKTVSQPTYRLLFDESDLLPAHTLVLILNVKPRFAIVGAIPVDTARAVRTWGDRLPRPAWVVAQGPLLPWGEACPHRAAMVT